MPAERNREEYTPPAGLEWATGDLLAQRTRTTPERTALIDVATEREWTYRDLDVAVDRLSRRLSGSMGERIGVLLETRPTFAMLPFAAMRTGRTLVLLNCREAPVELAEKATRAGVKSFLCGRETESLARDVREAMGDGVSSEGDESETDTDSRSVPVYSIDEPETTGVRSLSEPGGKTGNDAETNEGHGTETSEDVNSDSNDDAILLIAFTSGTTGTPKGVTLTAANLVSSAVASAFRLGVDRTDRWLCCLPMYHMGGLAPAFRCALYGTTVVLQRAFEPPETARVLEEYDVTGVSLVPTMLDRLLDAGWEPASSLRFVLLGGASASAGLLERCERTGVPVYPTYGMTETASQIATATPQEAFAHDGTVGQPLVCTTVSVLDDDGTTAEPGTAGELVVSGPTVTPGYLDPERTAAAFSTRGLQTGDVGYRDEDGRLWIRDRRIDRIVTGGENVDPAKVRQVLESHSGVRKAAVVGLEDPEWGERVAALVVPEDGDGSLEISAVQNYCRERLAGFKVPKTIRQAPALPRTASGTVDREEARAKLEERDIDLTES
ncbi:acyl--CoA ligase [Halobacteria archaeon AArc-curdl1]|uniref:Acyl--CoA ligase n=1 Tax=Natronosalvus hydrolyticus TaxID=2979988 RepID=A0AAP3E7Z0_9EURY|nr:acyl--CoA ligase [Halobacteria archaeon AArc-curdl1]